MVKPIVDGLLTLLAPGIRVHEQRVGRVLRLGHITSNFLMFQVLALEEGFLVGEELFRGAALFANFFVDLWRELALFVRGFLLLVPLLFDLASAFDFPVT